MLRPSRPMIRPFMSSAGQLHDRDHGSRRSARRRAAGSRWPGSAGRGRRPPPRRPARWPRAFSAPVRRASCSIDADQLGAGLLGGQAATRSSSATVLLEVGHLGPVLRERLRVGDLVRRVRRAAHLVVEPLLALGDPLLAALDVQALLVQVALQLPVAPRRRPVPTSAPPRTGGQQQHDDHADDHERPRAGRPAARSTGPTPSTRGPGVRDLLVPSSGSCSVHAAHEVSCRQRRAPRAVAPTGYARI